MLRVIGGVLLCAVVAVAASAQSFKVLVTFDGLNGEDPFASLTEGHDGSLYGTTVYGGTVNSGTVFKISPQGVYTVLYSFCAQANCTDGAYPGWLTQAADGDFYGETYNGGGVGAGTVFKITSGGELTTLYNFCTQTNCADGALPQSALVQISDGSLYGTTVIGGAQNQGTIFKITTSGVLTTLHSFCVIANCADGAQPNIGLLRASDGNFYGTAALGGNSNKRCLYRCGTLFRFTRAGKFQTIYSFCAKANCTDGLIPQGLLLEAKDGSLYGTTDGGGNNDFGTVFRIRSGKLTTIHSFCSGSCVEGGIPYAGVIQGSDGNFYGTTNLGGAGGFGTVYRLTPSGTITALQSFDDGTDGAFPVAAVVQGTDGNLYGGTEQGGDDACYSPTGCGVIFRLSKNAAMETVPEQLTSEVDHIQRLQGERALETAPATPLSRAPR